jgi:GAG-pre-integrase domain
MYKGNVTEPGDWPRDWPRESTLNIVLPLPQLREDPLLTDFDTSTVKVSNTKRKTTKVFRVDGPNVTSDSDTSTPEIQQQDPTSELLGWHHKFSHISMKRLQTMAAQGYLPKRLATCRIPICQACVFGKSSRRAWRTKSRTETVATTTPGQGVSVDQLESTVPGLMGQMKGRLTRDRYKVATIFVDNFSNFSYVHLQKGTTSLETLEAKNDFEQLAASYGVKIEHYRGVTMADLRTIYGGKMCYESHNDCLFVEWARTIRMVVLKNDIGIFKIKQEHLLFIQTDSGRKPLMHIYGRTR